ncbi:winged helix-turn-helix transcriptional regulator [Micromonospora sp. NBC_00421]|uniref:winged helix-turn-helix transcriptional regulator n=1 Tax=Micromonospora sp. NBC_00421 TaxID=2975976 RepID=UPI003FA54800
MPDRAGETRWRRDELTRQLAALRQLERNGVVDRTLHATVPPRTEYRLTPAGRDLHDTINDFCRWSRRQLDEVLTSRRRFD